MLKPPHLPVSPFVDVDLCNSALNRLCIFVLMIYLYGIQGTFSFGDAPAAPAEAKTPAPAGGKI